jgi:hypothetical protein
MDRRLCATRHTLADGGDDSGVVTADGAPSVARDIGPRIAVRLYRMALPLARDERRSPYSVMSW